MCTHLHTCLPAVLTGSFYTCGTVENNELFSSFFQAADFKRKYVLFKKNGNEVKGNSNCATAVLEAD